MTTGTGPQALAKYLRQNWQPTRVGRNDVPDVIRDSNSDPIRVTGPRDIDEASGPGEVLIVNDRDVIANRQAVFDLVHCYHPQAAAPDITDRGYKEVNEVETVQIDIEVTDRSDPDTGERLFARERLVGDREAAGFPGDESPPYPGIMGEVKQILETGRRGLEEWDVARMDVVNLFLGNSNASISWSVGLEHIARNTVQ